VHESGRGTFETYQPALKMSAYRGRQEVKANRLRRWWASLEMDHNKPVERILRLQKLGWQTWAMSKDAMSQSRSCHKLCYT